MEIKEFSSLPPEDRFMSFWGKGATYFGIIAVNFILTVVTLGLYYPWAKAKVRSYIWNETELEESRFVFHGTGREMFKGFVIAYILLLSFYAFYFLMIGTDGGNYAIIGFFTLFVVMMFWFLPFAIFSSWRYRVSRTSWRGIYFSFSGRFSEFYKTYLKYLFFTVISLGIGYAWFKVAMQKYLISHTKLGNLKMDFHGEGSDLFVINILGGILFYPTLGLYMPYFIKNRFNFSIDNMTLADDTKRRAFKSTLTGGTAFKILITNFLLLIITVGLAFPFTHMRYMKMLFEHIGVPHDIDFDNITQEAEFYNQATGDELLDILDVDIDF